MVTIPRIVSRGIQRHTPHIVPSTSSHVTTMKAPTYSIRLRPHTRNPTRQRYQKAPRRSGRGEIHSPHDAARAPRTIVATTATRASRARTPTHAAKPRAAR